MSDEKTKEIHSKRIHQKENTIHKQEKIAKMHGLEVEEPHRYLKHHVMNCGQPGCILCSNPRKTFREKTIQEKKFDETLKWE
jgi:hypothetical protein